MDFDVVAIVMQQVLSTGFDIPRHLHRSHLSQTEQLEACYPAMEQPERRFSGGEGGERRRDEHNDFARR